MFLERVCTMLIICVFLNLIRLHFAHDWTLYRNECTYTATHMATAANTLSRPCTTPELFAAAHETPSTPTSTQQYNRYTRRLPPRSTGTTRWIPSLPHSVTLDPISSAELHPITSPYRSPPLPAPPQSRLSITPVVRHMPLFFASTWYQDITSSPSRVGIYGNLSVSTQYPAPPGEKTAHSASNIYHYFSHVT